MMRVTWKSLLLLLFFGLFLPVLADDDSSHHRSESKNTYSTHVTGKATLPADKVSLDFTVSVISDDAEGSERKFKKNLQLLRDVVSGKEVHGRVDDDDDDGDEPVKKTPPKDKNNKKKFQKPQEEMPTRDEGTEKPNDPRKTTPRPGHKIDDDDDDDKPAPKKKSHSKDDEVASVTSQIPVQLQEGGFAFAFQDNRMARGWNPQGQPIVNPSGFRYACNVSLVFSNLTQFSPQVFQKQLAKLLDQLSDRNLVGLDTPFTVRYEVSSPSSLRTLAYQDALTQARERMRSVSELSGHHSASSRILCVKEEPLNSEAFSPNPLMPRIRPPFQSTTAERVEDSMQVATQVNLYVEFELSDK